MIGDRRVLGVITARGGSKAVPRKNVLPLSGKPLIAWTIEAAARSAYIDRLILSSDDEEIIDVARAFGCEVPFRRPEALARDDTSSVDVLLHAVAEVPGYDYTVLLQPTSPLRSTEDIDGCIERCHRSGTPACVTVTEVDKPPQWMYRLDPQGRLAPLLAPGPPLARRQDAAAVYALNGAVYVVETAWLVRQRAFVTPEAIGYPMPKERSIDIDSETDFIVAGALLAHASASRA